jgi:hypothetical protein
MIQLDEFNLEYVSQFAVMWRGGLVKLRDVADGSFATSYRTFRL